MKRIILAAILIFMAGSIFSQTLPNSFKIINNQHPEQENFYVASIQKANMENYRLQNKDVTVHFENGFDCIFVSAKDLFLQGVHLNATSYKENFPEDFALPSFNIVPAGNLVAIYPLKTKKFK